MRKHFKSLLVACLFCAALSASQTGCARHANEATVGPGIDISVDYLNQARAYRDQGRYDLARQSYAQALSTCRNNANLEIIKREMAGTELLIRTMR